MANISVIGSGAFGTSLAIYSNKIGHNVKVWSFEESLPTLIEETGQNETYLPGIDIPSEIKFSSNMEDVLNNSDLVLFVCPSAHLRRTAMAAKPFINDKALIVTAAKGIEDNTYALMSQVMEDVLSHMKDNLAFLSGPSFAKDVARGLPTDLSCASHDIEVARKVQDILHSPTLRIYSNDDIIGVELGGALKNIIAIACGVSDGLNFGASARASLMTRGLSEISRLGVALGAKALTFLGLSGVGDLILTCTGDLSRNRTLGKKISEGNKAFDVINSQKSVAEGYVTAKPVFHLAKKLNVDMPICEAVYRVCYENIPLDKITKQLMERPQKDEFKGLQQG